MPRTSQEAHNCFIKHDSSYIQNFFHTKKLELILEIAYHMFRGSSLITLETAARAEIIASGNPSKEKEHWKSKFDVVIDEGIKGVFDAF